jgi:hypothetical protein
MTFLPKRLLPRQDQYVGWMARGVLVRAFAQACVLNHSMQLTACLLADAYSVLFRHQLRVARV